MTSIGPLAGGYLTQWTWRAIFWINVPVAIPRPHPHRSRAHRRGAPPGAHRRGRRRPALRRDLSVGGQWLYIVIAGAGTGLILGPVSTDAVNRAPRASYGEVTGITQTARNFGSSLGLAVLGSILVAQNTSRIETTLEGRGVPAAAADRVANALSLSGGGDTSRFSERAGPQARALFDAVQLDFAHSLRTVLFIMAAVMAVAFVVALVAVPRGRAPEAAAVPDAEPQPAG
jgi:MFS family permease